MAAKPISQEWNAKIQSGDHGDGQLQRQCAHALMEVHEETKDPRLLAVIDDHMAWLKQTAHQKGAKRGIDALFWTSRHELEPTRRAAKPRPLLSGNS